MRDTHLAQRTQPPSSRGTVHRIDEPLSAVLRRRTDRLTESVVGRDTREGDTLTLAADSHRAVDHGHSPRKDGKVGERVRKGTGQRPRVEMPLEEEDNVDRQVRDHDITDIATDFEPFCVQWS